MNEIEYPLTPEQEAIVTAPPEQPQLVVAPPGAGKTHTVVARIRYLVENAGLYPATELLVLCFTRVAVREITKRLKDLVKNQQVHDDLRFVSIRTFDSFATRILLAAETEKELSGFGYDERIDLAVEALNNPASDASAIVSNYRHIIVDEIQDLVGPRARLVQVLLKRISGGFTLLGDPAQAIYGFSIKNARNRLNSGTLLEWVKQQPWISSLVEKTLTSNYRSTGETARLAHSIRKEVLSKKQDDPETLQKLQKFVSNLKEVGSGLRPGEELTSLRYNTVCVLCRSNGEVLQLASLLASKGVKFYLRSQPNDVGLPAWLGRVLGTCSSPRISWPEFFRRWKNLIDQPDQPDPEQAWEWLKRVEAREESDLDIQRLHRAFYRGQGLPDDMDAFVSSVQDGLSISTIHSVKGREFDEVIILQPEEENSIRSTPGSPLEEARVLYVAATRARKELTKLGRNGLPFMWHFECQNGKQRWISRSRSGYYYIEIGLFGDVDPCSPVSAYIYPDEYSLEEAQDFLWHQVNEETPLHIYLKKITDHYFYQISCNLGTEGKTIDLAQLSLSAKTDFQLAVKSVSKGKSTFLPGSLKEIRVAKVVTEVLPPFPKNVHEPYASSGFCLGLRIRGMGFLYKEQ